MLKTKFDKKNLLKLLMPLLLLMALIPYTVAAQTDQPDPHLLADKPTFDRHFIDFMVPAHEAVIELSEIGIDRVNDEELRVFLRGQIQRARIQNDILRDWREDWFGSETTPPLTAARLVPETAQWEMGRRTVDLSVFIDQAEQVDDELIDQYLIDSLILIHNMAVQASQVARHHDEHIELYRFTKLMAVEHEAAILHLAAMRNKIVYGLGPGVEPPPMPTPLPTTETPEATNTPDGTGAPEATSTPEVTDTAEPTATVEDTATPEVTDTVEVTETVAETLPVDETASPGVTETVVETVSPGETIPPGVTDTPVVPTPTSGSSSGFFPRP